MDSFWLDLRRNISVRLVAQTPASFWASLPADLKVQMVREMGFVPMGSNHQPDCPFTVDSGFRCNCVRPATEWAQPPDVDVLRRETWDERLAERS